MEEIVAVVTARGGSRGVPGKNVKHLGGVPLIAWSIKAALRSTSITRVIVSTDDSEIAHVAEAAGAEVPFVRPPQFSQDDSPHIDVILHALDWLNAHDCFPHRLLTMQPTSPFRTAEDIDQATAIARQSNADAVLGVCQTEVHPAICQQIESGGELKPFLDFDQHAYLRRQDLKPAYVINGAIYLNKCESIREEGSLLPPGSRPYVMPEERSLDIDTLWDFELAEWMLSRGTLSPQQSDNHAA